MSAGERVFVWDSWRMDGSVVWPAGISWRACLQPYFIVLRSTAATLRARKLPRDADVVWIISVGNTLKSSGLSRA